MRDVSPIFNRSNQGGPFSPIIAGDSVKLSTDSFVFSNGSNLGSAIPVTMSPAKITSELKVYLEILLKDNAIEKIEVRSGNSWWSTYPNTIKYSGSEEKIDKQSALYAPIFSVSSSGATGTYAKIDGIGNIIVYRHIYNNLMLMQTCKYFFLLPAPCAPGLTQGQSSSSSITPTVVTI